MVQGVKANDGTPAGAPRPTALKLRNFKGIAELDLMLDESLTLLAGVNGVGKTSVLQALLAAVTHAWSLCHPRDYPRFAFSENVARAGTRDTEIMLECTVSGQPSLDDARLDARFDLVGDGLRLDPLRSSRIGFLESFQWSLPLVVYYEQNRGAHPESEPHGVSFSPQYSRDSALHTTVSSPNEFKAWFFDKEADEGQEVRERKDPEYTDRELAAVRQLLGQLDGFTAVRSRRPPESGERILFLEKGGVNIPFDSLSGGEQAFFLLAADLARRLMLASPGTPLEETPGIVCIDEIELHLHPAWQKRILRTLMDTFPACQFIVSTHSPQVIGGVEAHHVRLLEPAGTGLRTTVSRPIASKGRDSNYVLEGILDTPARDDDVSALFDEFDRLIDAGELEDAGQVLDRLGEVIEGESSRVAVRQAKWNRLRRAAK